MATYSNDLYDLIDKYFSIKEASFISKELEKIELPDKGVFYRVSSREETTELQIVFAVDNAIFNYQFKGKTKELTLIPIRSVSEVRVVFGPNGSCVPHCVSSVPHFCPRAATQFHTASTCGKGFFG